MSEVIEKEGEPRVIDRQSALLDSDLDALDDLIAGKPAKKVDDDHEQLKEKPKPDDQIAVSAANIDTDDDDDDDPGEEDDSKKKIDYDEVVDEAKQDQEISLADDFGKQTVGQLKDTAQEYFREKNNLIRQQAEIDQEREQLMQYGQLVNQHVTPEQRQWFADRERVNMEKSTRVMLEAHPEWKDQNVMMTARDEMVAIAEMHGIPKASVLKITDPYVINLLNGYAKLHSRVYGKALEGKPAGPKEKRNRNRNTNKQGKKRTRTELHDAAKTGNETDKVAYINNLIGS